MRRLLFSGPPGTEKMAPGAAAAAAALALSFAVPSVLAYDSQAFKASEEQMHRTWNVGDCRDVTEEALRDGKFEHLGPVRLPWASLRLAMTEIERDEEAGRKLEGKPDAEKTIEEMQQIEKDVRSNYPQNMEHVFRSVDYLLGPVFGALGGSSAEGSEEGDTTGTEGFRHLRSALQRNPNDAFPLANDLLATEANVCMFGVIALLYHYVLYMVDTDQENTHVLDEVFLYHSLLDSFVGNSHPSLMEKGRWGVSSEQLVHLRHRILNRKWERKRRQMGEMKAAAAIGGGKAMKDDASSETKEGAGSSEKDQTAEEAQAATAAVLEAEKARADPANPHGQRPVKIYVYDMWSNDAVENDKVWRQPADRKVLQAARAAAGYAPLYSLSQASAFCARGQWGQEVSIHDWLLQSVKHRTRDPAEADFFFVPGYGICMYEANFLPLPQIDTVYRDLVQMVDPPTLVRGGQTNATTTGTEDNENDKTGGKVEVEGEGGGSTTFRAALTRARSHLTPLLPFFNSKFDRNGRKHIFSFGSGMGINVLFSWKELLPDSIFLTPETSLYNDFPHVTVPPFRTWQHIVIPGNMHRAEISGLSRAAQRFGTAAQKRYTGVFFGRVDPSRGVHPELARQDGTARDVRNQLVKLMQGTMFETVLASGRRMLAMLGVGLDEDSESDADQGSAADGPPVDWSTGLQHLRIGDDEVDPAFMALGPQDELQDQGAVAVGKADEDGKNDGKGAGEARTEGTGKPSSAEAKHARTEKMLQGIPFHRLAVHGQAEGVELDGEGGDVDVVARLLEAREAVGKLDLSTTSTDDFYVGYVGLFEMHELMGSSKFCFVPRGKSAWSLRFFEALVAECVSSSSDHVPAVG